jgi:hypothetical protein
MRYAANDEGFVILRRKFLRWSIDNMAALKSAKPKMPSGFFSRLEENYHLLFAIADLAGSDRGKKARAAAIKLSKQHDTRSEGKRLLSDVFDLFVKHGTLQRSEWVETLLTADDGGEWANYNKGHPISKWQIAALLRPYCDIQPKNISIKGKTHRGYDGTWPEFTTAFKHYLGKELPATRSVVREKKPRK